MATGTQGITLLTTGIGWILATRLTTEPFTTTLKFGGIAQLTIATTYITTATIQKTKKLLQTIKKGERKWH